MNDKIDVLAVWDWMHAASNRDRREMKLDQFAESDAQMEAQELAARAAIAELIEATPALLALYRIKWGNLDKDANSVLEMFERAFARVGGGK